MLGGGHQGDVDEVGATSAAEVRMGEAEDGVAVVVIAATGIPCDILLGFRSELHHALRHRRTRERAAAQGSCVVGLCADERIDILGVVRRHTAAHERACSEA